MPSFHAHVCFDPANPEHARSLSTMLPEATGATVTSWPDLLHPETGDDLLDHTAHAVWFGPPRELRLDRL